MVLKKNKSISVALIIFIAGLLASCSSSNIITPTTTYLPVAGSTAANTPTSFPTHPVIASPFRTQITNATPGQINLTQLITLSDYTCNVTNLKWSPDSSLLASSCGFFSSTSQDGTIRLWHPDGKLAYVLKAASQPVITIAWSPDSRTLAAGYMDGTIDLWSSSGQLVKEWSTNAGQVFAVAWSPDGKILASGSIVSVTNPTVQLWDSSGRLINTLSTSYSGGKFYNLAWSPDGKYLVGGATDYKLWKSDGTQVFWLTACANCTPAWALAWSPDSKLWAIGNENGEVEVYDTTGELVASMQDRTDVNCLAWSPDGATLAGAKALWRSDGTLLANLVSPAQRVNSVAWSPDGSLLATGDSDGLLRLFSASGDAMQVIQAHSANVEVVTWSPDGKTLASSGDDQLIKLWQVRR